MEWVRPLIWREMRTSSPDCITSVDALAGGGTPVAATAAPTPSEARKPRREIPLPLFSGCSPADVEESSEGHFDCLGSFPMEFPLCKWLSQNFTLQNRPHNSGEGRLEGGPGKPTASDLAYDVPEYSQPKQ